jgi:hypothetical protein
MHGTLAHRRHQRSVQSVRALIGIRKENMPNEEAQRSLDLEHREALKEEEEIREEEINGTDEQYEKHYHDAKLEQNEN